MSDLHCLGDFLRSQKSVYLKAAEMSRKVVFWSDVDIKYGSLHTYETDLSEFWNAVVRLEAKI